MYRDLCNTEYINYFAPNSTESDIQQIDNTYIIKITNKERYFMLKKTVTYVDYNGVERTEDFYFNLSKAEVAEMELSVEGGFSKMLEEIVKSNDNVRIVELFKQMVLKAYGEKSADGKRFVKSKELSEAFSQTEAYSEIFMELALDEKAAAAFVNGIMPANLGK